MTEDAEENKAYITFISKLAEQARTAKRVTLKDKPVDNEKYAFRCFLLRLGTKGTVVCVDDIGTIHVHWDNGSSLGVAYDEDRCRVIAE